MKLIQAGCRKMHLERNATWGFAFGDRCFGPFCDSLHLSHSSSRWPSLPIVISTARSQSSRDDVARPPAARQTSGATSALGRTGATLGQ